MCLLALALPAIGTARASGVASAGRDYFGMNAQQVFKLPPADWDLQLAAIAATGVGVVRRDAFWSSVEPVAPVGGVHSYTWTKLDAVAAALARHGLRWYPILDYATPWAGTVDGPKRWKSAPANVGDFAAYAAAFARRYGSSGSFWAANPQLPRLPVDSYEVWNEPNLADFWPDVVGAADRYAALLAATLPAVRAADPAGRVVVGGLSPTGLTTFLDEVEAQRAGVIASADAVAFHPYGTTWANTGARIAELRAWLDAHGAAALPLEITETGWATPPLPEQTRAARMATLVAGLPASSCDVTRFVPHTWLTPDVDQLDPNDYFGIANADATLKPTGVAFAAAVAAVEGGTAPAPSDPCAGRVAPSPPAPEPDPDPVPAPAPAPEPAPAPDPGRALDPAPRSQAGGARGAGGSHGSRAHAAAAAARVAVRVRRRGPRSAVVAVRCARRCHAAIRVLRPRGATVRAWSSRRALRRRAVLLLPPRARDGVRIEVRIRVNGHRPVRVIRTLR